MASGPDCKNILDDGGGGDFWHFDTVTGGLSDTVGIGREYSYTIQKFTAVVVAVQVFELLAFTPTHSKECAGLQIRWCVWLAWIIKDSLGFDSGLLHRVKPPTRSSQWNYVSLLRAEKSSPGCGRHFVPPQKRGNAVLKKGASYFL